MFGGFTFDLPSREILRSCGPVMSRVLSCTAVSKSSLGCFASHWCSCPCKQIVNKAIQQHMLHCNVLHAVDIKEFFSSVLLNIHHINPYILPPQLHWLSAVFVWNMPESMWEWSEWRFCNKAWALPRDGRRYMPIESRSLCFPLVSICLC